MSTKQATTIDMFIVPRASTTPLAGLHACIRGCISDITCAAAAHGRIDGVEHRTIPARFELLEKAHPVYTTLPGWKQSTVGILEFEAGTTSDVDAAIEEETRRANGEALAA